ncbi:MAG: 2-amino-4-hydroxy-6-hydroxymethyldihydropteridine diphosphokinase [Legionellales bacterium RIFCSPHIGHO2_12_FULL_42_9]|nr:MAG: 2-amino-4-hydroxy-6-hydroxymethyldihydropteridine diphosphokinase [Legionellales bacterium RIFCSPHIGHO2_12_FULL_42_9]
MIISYLALGSNLKTPARQLYLAIYALRRAPGIQVLSIAPFFPNKAVGRRAQPNFCNTVVKVMTTLTPQRLLSCCRTIEKKQGRIRRTKWAARTLDIDILLYGQQRIQTPSLTIPHPELSKRDFVIIPLLQINPDLSLISDLTPFSTSRIPVA